MARQFEQFVEKEHAAVRQAHFAWPRTRPTADQSRERDRVVRGAEWRRARGNRPWHDEPTHRMNRDDFEEFIFRERRENSGKPTREHCLTSAWRAQHHHVVAAGRRDLERSLGGRLPRDIGEIEHISTRRVFTRAVRRSNTFQVRSNTSELRDQRSQGGRRCDARRTRERRLGDIRFGNHEARSRAHRGAGE